MRLQVAGGLHRIEWAGHPSQTPTGHCIGLGNAVHHDGSVDELGHSLGDRNCAQAVVNQVLVDLVSDDPHSVLVGPAPDGFGLFVRIDRSGWVRRANEQQNLRFRGARGLELVNRDLVALVCASKHFNWHSTGKANGLGIGCPERGRHQNLVARVEQSREGLVNRLFSAICDHYLGSGDLGARVDQSLLGDGLAKVWQADGRGVAVVFGV